MGGSTQGTPAVSTVNTKQNTSGTTQGINYGDVTGTTSQNVTLPSYLQDLVTSIPGMSLTQLQDLTQGVQGFQIPQESLDALRKTAGGDFLYGGPEMQAFTDAAMRAASPGIFSAFGGAGRAGSGLERTALGQAGIDAFAGLFNNERNRQLSAATALPQLGMLPLTLQSQLLSQTAALPNQFASLFGQTGDTSQSSFGETYGTNTSKTKGTQVTSQPTYETPWWQSALGAGALLASIPLTGGASAAGIAAAPTLGGAALTGLLGAFK